MTSLDSILKSRDITLPAMVCIVKAMVFPVVTYGCESWILRRLFTEELMLSNCGVGEDLESPLKCKEMKSDNSEGNRHQIFIGRTEAEAPIF